MINPELAPIQGGEAFEFNEHYVTAYHDPANPELVEWIITKENFKNLYLNTFPAYGPTTEARQKNDAMRGYAYNIGELTFNHLQGLHIKLGVCRCGLEPRYGQGDEKSELIGIEASSFTKMSPKDVSTGAGSDFRFYWIETYEALVQTLTTPTKSTAKK